MLRYIDYVKIHRKYFCVVVATMVSDHTTM